MTLMRACNVCVHCIMTTVYSDDYVVNPRCSNQSKSVTDLENVISFMGDECELYY